MLDLVSDGRVEFGTGESSSEAELAGFGVDRVTKREAWLEGLEVAIRCMTETPFGGVDGRYVTMPPRNVVPEAGAEAPPAPVGGLQPPGHHPAGGREGHRRAELRLRRARGRQAVGRRLRGRTARPVRPGRAVRQPPGGLRDPDDVCRDEDEALARGLEGANFFGYSLAHFYVFGDHVPAPPMSGRSSSSAGARWATRRRRRWRPGTRRLGAKAAAGDHTGLRGAVGHPGPAPRVPPSLRGCRRRPADLRHAGRPQPTRDIMESIELFGTQVLPEFVERDEAAAGPRRPSGSR